jgi:hypothetical protein
MLLCLYAILLILLLYFSTLYNAQALKAKIANLEGEDAKITARMTELKKALYARFGDSINLD